MVRCYFVSFIYEIPTTLGETFKKNCIHLTNFTNLGKFSYFSDTFFVVILRKSTLENLFIFQIQILPI